MITQRELILAKQAAAKFLHKEPEPIVCEKMRPIDKRCTGAVRELEIRFRKANAAYEQGKKQGATMRSIEAEFGLNHRSLNNWRSYRIINGNDIVMRVNKRNNK